MKTFYLYVDLGDLIYSLAFAKILGIENYVIDGNKGINKFNNVNKEFIISFIKEQSYLKTVESFSNQSYDCDYALHPENKKVVAGTNLVEYHASKFNINWKLINKPWLTAKTLDFNKKIVINRSARYHNDYLMYHDFLRHVNLKDCVFVGLESEWQSFCADFKKPIDFYKALDGSDLAAAINGCETFLGNQSLSLAIATGLGKNCIVETGLGCANYIFNSKKIIYF